MCFCDHLTPDHPPIGNTFTTDEVHPTSTISPLTHFDTSEGEYRQKFPSLSRSLRALRQGADLNFWWALGVAAQPNDGNQTSSFKSPASINTSSMTYYDTHQSGAQQTTAYAVEAGSSYITASSGRTHTQRYSMAIETEVIHEQASRVIAEWGGPIQGCNI